MHLRRRIELYLKRTGIPPSRFGEEALNDRSFVSELRGGRRPRADTIARVHAWLDGREKKRRCCK